MSVLVLQSSWWGRESWLLCLICLPGVSWWLSGSSSRCHGVVCGLWLWYFLIILTYYFSSLLYEYSHFLTTLFDNTHIFAQIFSSETKIVIFICKLCLQTANRVYKNQRTVYEYVNILFNQVYEWVIFIAVQVNDWGRFQKTGPHTRTKITLKRILWHYWDDDHAGLCVCLMHDLVYSHAMTHILLFKVQILIYYTCQSK